MSARYSSGTLCFRLVVVTMKTVSKPMGQVVSKHGSNSSSGCSGVTRPLLLKRALTLLMRRLFLARMRGLFYLLVVGSGFLVEYEYT